MAPIVIAKSRNHQIVSNPDVKHPYRLLWEVPRRGGSMGFPVKQHRDTDREGAVEFANRWGLKVPK